MSERLTARVRALLAARPQRPGFDERRARAALGYSDASPRSIMVAPRLPFNQARPPSEDTGGGRAYEPDQEFGGEPQDTAG